MRVFTKEFWLEPDKQKHCAGSALMTIVFSAIFMVFGDVLIAMGVAFIMSLAVGVGKEIWDYNGHGTPDVEDIYADTVGNIAGIVIFSLIYLV